MPRYEYVRLFEQPDILLANTWIVVRIDGRGFSKYVLNLFIFLFSVTAVSFLALLAVCVRQRMQVPVTWCMNG